MKKTAGILKFLCSIALFFEGVAGVIVAFAVGALLFMGDFSHISLTTNQAIEIQGDSLTPEQMNALKPVILVAALIAMASIVFAFLGTSKFRKALGECKKETPFTTTSINAIKASARYEIIGGLVGIIGSIVLYVMGQGIKVNGTSVASSMNTIHLTFLIYAAEKYLLYHIAQYGHSLENK